MTPLTDDERERWDRDPREWPHTPPLHVFRALLDDDDNLWWRVECGHHLNVFDAACDALDAERGQ